MATSHRQLRLRSLFLLTAMVATYCALVTARDWLESLIITVSMVIVVGLCQQTWDIHRALGHWTVHRPGAKTIWRIGMAWRLLIACLLLAYWVNELFELRLEQLLGDVRDDAPHLLGESSFFDWSESLLYVLLILSLNGGVIEIRPRQTRTSTQRLWDGLGIVAGAGLLLIAVWEIHLVLAITVMGLHVNLFNAATLWQGEPLTLAIADQHLARFAQAQAASIGALAMSLMALGILRVALFHSRQRPREVVTWIAWLIFALPPIGFSVWMHVKGLSELCPPFAESSTDAAPMFVVFIVVIFGGLLTFAVTLRLFAEFEPACDRLPGWNSQHGYWHNGRFLAACLCLYLLLTWQYFFLYTGTGILKLSLLLLGLRNLMGRRSAERTESFEKLAPTSLLRFVVSAVAIGTSLMSLVESLRWASVPDQDELIDSLTVEPCKSLFQPIDVLVNVGDQSQFHSGSWIS